MCQNGISVKDTISVWKVHDGGMDLNIAEMKVTEAYVNVHLTGGTRTHFLYQTILE